jgi:hypothetical protein
MARQIQDAEKRSSLMFWLGAGVFLIMGFITVASGPKRFVDFRAMYTAARCLLSHQDPYDQGQILRVYQAEDKEYDPADERMRDVIRLYVYPPSTFVLTAPFALLPWKLAKTFWLMLFALSTILAARLIWSVAVREAPAVSGLFIAFLLINNQVLWMTGHVSGIAIALCVIAVWCFVRERFLPAGILCLALSLMVKPQDCGLVWLYFLMAGGLYRKRALQTLCTVAALSLPMLLWVSRVAPHWPAEIQTNVHALLAPGGIASPGLASSGAHGLAEIVSLQAVFSVFRDNSTFYNMASYLLCAPLLLIFAATAFRKRVTAQNAWLAMAVVSVLTMLPVYHRLYDARLFLLAVPACAMLWSRQTIAGKLALAGGALYCLLAGEIPRVILLALVGAFARWSGHYAMPVTIGGTILPLPLLFLLLSVFFLWALIVEKPQEKVAAGDSQA